jgi:nucleotide-binding universal stress UspA family protein
MDNKRLMRIVVAYDGSAGSELAIEHLRRRRAGLPAKARVTVVTNAELGVAVPAWVAAEADGGIPPMRQAVREARMAAAAATSQARAQAERAARRLRSALPGWTIDTSASAGPTAHHIIAFAKACEADLIVLGWRGRHLVLRWLLGSVAQQVLNEAPCSVRVVRSRIRRSNEPVSLVIGMDGSPGAKAAVQEMARRRWPPGSSARIVAAIDWGHPWPSDSRGMPSSYWAESMQQHTAWLTQAANESAHELQAAGCAAKAVIRSAEPKQALVQEARRTKADALVVGATGARGLARLLMGTVATSVALRAPCSVEVVRLRTASRQEAGPRRAAPALATR